MKLRTASRLAVAFITGTVFAASMTLFTDVEAQQAGAAVAIDADDIGGIVTSAKGPEAGVWVIAETTETPARFARIVVTDDRGRYVVPDLPKATFQVFVRGYGLVDSAKQAAKPGQRLNLKAEIAPNQRAAAEVFPAAWWLSMVEVPPGNRAVTDEIRNCLNCHQMGNKGTREIPADVLSASSQNHLEAWNRRTAMGPVGPSMAGSFRRMGDHRQVLSNWTERVAKGEAPKQTPPRPAGVERSLVVTWWDWGTERDGRTDAAPADLHTPTVNANGPVYGVSQPTDLLLIMDPRENRELTITIPSDAPKTGANQAPSPYWGTERIWERSSDPRSTAVDWLGRVWLTGRIRANQNPAYCASNKFGKYYPLRNGGRQVIMYDPRTRQFTGVDTCFTSDHNQISHDHVMYFGMNNALGWIDLDAFDKTKNAETSQGWCPAVLDTTGDGKIGEFTVLKEPPDPLKDRQIGFGCYAVAVNPKDKSIWCSGIAPNDNKLVRIERGSNPPASCKAEVFEAPPTGVTPPVYGSGGLEVDSEGVVWQNFRGSGHFASFDRRKCKVTTGPKATGQSCPEGYTFYRRNGATYSNAPTIFSDESYLTHMDFHDTLGLGRDLPIYGNVNTDSFEAFVPRTKQFVTLRVPYPLGFFPRSGAGRIDDPKGGWKGKGFWSTYSTYAAWHLEGGKGTKEKLVKFQFRPNPLAK
jgi:hypothetical protein